MRILSWNIQFGTAADGVADLNLTLAHIKSMGDFDIICLQEIARNMKEYCRPDQFDQLQIIKQTFADFTPVWGTGFSWPGGKEHRHNRQEFGNLTLLKSMPLDYKIYQLPLPATPGNKQMQRVAIETKVDSKIGTLSILNTHLAYHDSHESQQQLERFTLLEQEREAHHHLPKEIDVGAYQQGYLPSARILCGDFNFATETSHYAYQLDNNWIDAWQHCRGSEPHLPTCGVYDSAHWPQGPHCRDFFWLSRELQAVDLSFTVDTETDLSDHQPIILEIDL